MREIKFRAWSKELKIMSPPFCLDKGELWAGYGGEIFVDFKPGKLSIEVEKCTLMQYTGLNDWSGKEIYEGDTWSQDYGYHKIYWDEFKAGWNLDKSLASIIEVIGNIYENSELLK